MDTYIREIKQLYYNILHNTNYYNVESGKQLTGNVFKKCFKSVEKYVLFLFISLSH